MKKVKDIFDAVYFALPIQLVIIQFRYHKLELVPWLVLTLTVTSNFGEGLGWPYLFLEPEYMGETGFYSMFLLGIGMGTFFAAYSIASYISDSYRFFFLAMEYRPFFTFFLNNTLIPTIFLVIYSWCYIDFQVYILGHFEWQILLDLSGVFLGIVMIGTFIFVYFFNTNKNFVHRLSKKVVTDLKGGRVIVARARAGMGIRNRVDYFFVNIFRIKQVDPNATPDFRRLVRTLNQNHGNALFLELILLIAILMLGWLDNNPYFQVPAGMSILFMLAVVLMLVSAFTFWFRKVGPLFVLVLFGVLIALNQVEVVKFRHPAIGMNYEIAPAGYNPERLDSLSSEENIRSDIAATEMILERWKKDHQLYHGPYSKPKAVVLCISGGGLRAAYFTTRILQKLDSITSGQFMQSARLFTGASGGMVGAGYYRELSYLQELGQVDSIYRREFANRMGTDLLNRIMVRMVTGMFVPSRMVDVGASSYRDDRGYSFDQQLVQNLGVFENRRLSDYSSLEELAVIPMMLLSPVVVHDGRKMYISPVNVSYMTRNFDYRGELEDAITGVEFRRLFEEQDADSLLWVTALRMNASFPVITPYIRLPSEPSFQVMDAGVADNYGLETAERFMYLFSEWFRENTDGVMLLQIRDSPTPMAAEMQMNNPSSLQNILDPIGGTYNAYSMSADLQNEKYIHNIDQYMEGQLVYEKFYYEPADSGGLRASLSWHLTQREIAGLEASLETEQIRSAMRRVKEWLED